MESFSYSFPGRGSSYVNGGPSLDALDEVEGLFPHFGEAYSGLHAAFGNMKPGRVNVDWIETGTEHVFKLDLPGVSREDMRVRVETGRKLIISGERKKDHAPEGVLKWHSRQIRSGRFEKQFRLPDNSNMNAITANLDKGVLTIVVRKLEMQAQARNVDIREVPDQPGQQQPVPIGDVLVYAVPAANT